MRFLMWRLRISEKDVTSPKAYDYIFRVWNAVSHGRCRMLRGKVVDGPNFRIYNIAYVLSQMTSDQFKSLFVCRQQ